MTEAEIKSELIATLEKAFDFFTSKHGFNKEARFFQYIKRDMIDGTVSDFVQNLNSDQSIRQCAYCGKAFGVGPAWGKSKTARFCCDSHRVMAAQQRAKAAER